MTLHRLLLNPALLVAIAGMPTAMASESAEAIQAFGLQGWRVTFKDEAGRTLSSARFDQLLRDRTLSISKDETRRTAVLQLEPKAPAKAVPPLAVKLGEAMPTLSGTSLDGKATTLAPDGNRYTLVAFYFAQCAPCLSEIPALNQLQAARPDLQVVGVTFDPLPTTRMLAAKRDIRYATLSGAKASIDALKLQGYPTLALLKPDGTLAAVKQGGEMAGKAAAAAALNDWVAQALAAAARKG